MVFRKDPGSSFLPAWDPTTFTDIGVGDTIEFTKVDGDGLSIYATDPAGYPIR